MAQAMQCNPHHVKDPWSFEKETRDRLLALDWFRSGKSRIGISEMGLAIPDAISNRSVTAYDADPDQFKSDMRALADELESCGL